MSLKGGMSATELFDTIDDARKGKKKAIKKLSEHHQKGYLSTEEYNKILTEYRINKDKKDRERSRKIKDVLCGVVAFFVLFGSFANTLGEIVVQHGKGIAFWYFFLWIWAFFYALSSSDDEIKKLKRENELLKERLEIYKKE